MKIYISNNKKQISEKINKLENNKEVSITLYSDEGIFEYDKNKKIINKIILVEDKVYDSKINNELVKIDDSKINRETYAKIPFKAYTVYKNEVIYKIDEKIQFIVVDGRLYYFNCTDLEYFKKVYIEICKLIFV